MKQLEKIIFQKKDTVGVINIDTGMLFYDYHEENNKRNKREVLKLGTN